MEKILYDFFQRIDEMLLRYVPSFEGKGWIFGIIGTVIATIIAYVVIKIIRIIFRRFQKRVQSWKGRRIKGLKLQDQEFLSEEQTTEIATTLVKWLSYIPILIVVYIYLNLVFGFFPATRGIAAKLLSYFINAVDLAVTGAIGYIPSLIILIVIFFITRYVIRFVRAFFSSIAMGRIKFSGFQREWAIPTFNIVRVLIVAFALVIAFPYLPGSDSPAFQGVSIFLGVLFSLASSSSLANVISGLALTYMDAFRIGDRVKIADAVGDVVDKSMFVTRVRTVKNVDITIPNGLVLNNHIINFSSEAREQGLVLHTTVTIGYDVPWRKVHDLLIESALATDKIEKEPKPFVLQTALDDYYVHYELNAYTKLPKQMGGIYTELYQNIQDRFHEAGVEIASPSISAVRDGSRVNIPDEYLPQDYNPPTSLPWPFQPSYKKPTDES